MRVRSLHPGVTVERGAASRRASRSPSRTTVPDDARRRRAEQLRLIRAVLDPHDLRAAGVRGIVPEADRASALAACLQLRHAAA